MLKGRPHILLAVMAIFFVALALAVFVISANLKRASGPGSANPKNQALQSARPNVPDYMGEKISYDIRLGAITVGRALLNYVSKSMVNGRLLNLITLETRIPQFTDLEKIYSDPETLLPCRVERKISAILKREDITEDYDQKNFTISITRRTFFGSQQIDIKKNGPIQNAILLPYYIRRIPNLVIGAAIPVNMPKYELKITLDGLETIETPAGTFKTYHFSSSPKQVEIWITADERRIPVKLLGVGTYGYLMVMREYKQ